MFVRYRGSSWVNIIKQVNIIEQGIEQNVSTTKVFHRRKKGWQTWANIPRCLHIYLTVARISDIRKINNNIGSLYIGLVLFYIASYEFEWSFEYSHAHRRTNTHAVTCGYMFGWRVRCHIKGEQRSVRTSISNEDFDRILLHSGIISATLNNFNH